MTHDGWLLTPERIAIHQASGTAVLADLHLGYHLTRRQAGDAVPLPTLEEQLAPLAQLHRRQPFSRLVIAGDLVERSPALVDAFLRWLDKTSIELAGVVPGNHDHRLVRLDLPLYPDGYELADWRIVHGDGELPGGKVVCGHWHPSVVRQGRKRPCFLLRSGRLILPAFCSEAAGRNVEKDSRFAGWRCGVILGKVVRDDGLLADGAARRQRPKIARKLNLAKSMQR